MHKYKYCRACLFHERAIICKIEPEDVKNCPCVNCLVKVTCWFKHKCQVRNNYRQGRSYVKYEW